MPQVPPLVMPPAEASQEVAWEDTYEGNPPVNAYLSVCREDELPIRFKIILLAKVTFQRNWKCSQLKFLTFST